MKWQVKTQDNQGHQTIVPKTGSDNLPEAMYQARRVAWEYPGTITFVEGPYRRVPAVYHFLRRVD